VRKWIGISVVLASIAGLWWYASTRPAKVTIATLERGRIRDVVEEEGKTRVVDRYVVSTPVAGRIHRIRLEEGDVVKKGRLLAEIDPVALQARVDEAEAEIRAFARRVEGVDEKRPREAELKTAKVQEQVADRELAATRNQLEEARAVLERVQKEAERTRALVRRESATASDLDRAEADEKAGLESVHAYEQRVKIRELEVATARLRTKLLRDRLQDFEWEKGEYRERIKALQAGMTAVRDDLRRTRVVSPIDGVVLNRYQESEQFLQAGARLLELGDLTQLEVEADFLSEDVAHMEIGMAAEIFGRAVGEATVPATIQRIHPAAFEKISSLGVEQQRVTVVLAIERGALPLGDQYRVEVRVILDAKQDVLTAPEGALFRIKGRWHVFVESNGRIELRAIETGLRDGRNREVVSGLEEGDRVVLHPHSALADGSRVTE